MSKKYKQQKQSPKNKGIKIKNKQPLSRSKMSSLVHGIISINSRGIGYVRLAEKISGKKSQETDVEITEESLGGALHGDEVAIAIWPQRRNIRARGQVEKIINRATLRFAGVVSLDEGGYFVIPDDKRVYMDFLISSDFTEELKNGNKVIVRLKEWSNPHKNPVVDIERVLGKAGENEVEMKAIALTHGFDYGFPENVQNEADYIKQNYNLQQNLDARRDFRDITTFTIDPDNAKDFDDALSFQTTESGLMEVGVHIADVSHFVQPKSALNSEALERGVSVYMVDRHLPMLPRVLSEDICSLKPNEDRLAFSAVFLIDKNAKVHEQWFGKTIIHSNHRFTYEDAQNVLDKKMGSEFSEALFSLNALAKKFKDQRDAQGSIDFEESEIRFNLDKDGHPKSIHRAIRLDTHKLVEEFMLLANRKVAEYVTLKEKKTGKTTPFIYRVHDAPNPEKIDNLAMFVGALGHVLPRNQDGATTQRDLKNLLHNLQGHGAEELVKTAVLRAMSKAVYSTINISHYGLAIENYTHFTSPIRRYPDIMVHRLLERYLKGEAISTKEINALQSAASHASEREARAQDAERTSIKYKQVEYMSMRVGQEMDCFISGVKEWGIYVENKDTGAEGLVRLNSLNDDYYILDEKKYRIVGQKKGKIYELGQKVRARLTGADLDRRTLDFVLI